ncbi:AarF/UbiB family protein [Paenibacillus hexagrammi]|uniref:AarF/UbiB family protein n=1 Tax=Paenibacillus hexagrammi TaxID=2908839 RepID=A0ABY3SG83_9BACL|nr:AarF/UbiB family protein [Paenibacillus sp. YPD9-1]UJF32095.1 AarF/UbiB family protein [Paenibacillus sp. YPD9-1]
MKEYTSITLSKGKPLIVHNPTTYKQIGQGAQGAVFQLSSKRCVKIYMSEKHCKQERKVLKAAKSLKSPYFPKLYAAGKKYVEMEFIDGVPILDFLKDKKKVPAWLAKEFIAMITHMKKLNFTRLDASPRHVLITKEKRIVVIDHVNSYRTLTPYPEKILNGLAAIGLREQFLHKVKALDSGLYESWSVQSANA